MIVSKQKDRSYRKKIIMFLVLFISSAQGRPWYRSSFYLIKLFDDFYDKKTAAYLDHNEKKDKKSRYHSILEEDLGQRFRAQALVTHDFTTEYALNCSGTKTSLSQYLFGSQPISLAQIFLPAQLACCDKLEAPASSEDECSTLCDQFLPQAATMDLCFNARQSVTTIDLSLAYKLKLWSDQDKLLIGVNLPIIIARRLLNLSLSRGALSNVDYFGGNAVDDFFKEFNSIDDFVQGYVFHDCKNLCYSCNERYTRFGNLGIFLALDVGKWINEESVAAIGLNMLLPTSKKINGDILWEYESDLAGQWLFNPFVRLDVQVNDYFNPSFFLGTYLAPSFKTIRRVPTLKQSEEPTTGSDTDLCLPGTLPCYTIEPFCMWDSTSALLADYATCVTKDPGTGMLFRIGNIIHNLWNIEALQLGLFYDFAYKKGDYITVNNIKYFCPQASCASCSTSGDNPISIVSYKTGALNETNNISAHIIEWLLSYQMSDHVGWSLGTYHTIAGKNIFKINSLFAKLNFYF